MKNPILIIGEWTANFSEHFQCLADIIRAHQPGFELHGLMYKTKIAASSNECATFQSTPFNKLIVVQGEDKLRVMLSSDNYFQVFLFVKHYASTGDYELFHFVRQMIPEAVCLLRTASGLQSWYEYGSDQTSKIAQIMSSYTGRAREINLKVYLIYLVGLLLISAGKMAAPFRKKVQRHRILFMRLDVLGDMVLTLPALLALRKQYPDSEITLLASQRSGLLVEQQQHIEPGRFCDRIVYWQAPWHSQKETLQGVASFISLTVCALRLFQENFHLVIQPVELGTGVFFAALLRGKQTIATIAERLPLARLMKKHVNGVLLPCYAQYHIADLPGRVVMEAGCQDITAFKNNVLIIVSETVNELTECLRKRGWNEQTKLIVVNIGAGDPKRRWASHCYAELLTRLVRSGLFFPIMVGGEGERELGEAVCALADEPVVSLVGALDLNQLIALLSLADVVVTPDTGVMHLAAALDRKIVALFGAGLVPFCRPLCSTSIIVKHELGCSGCGDICFSNEDVPCMKLIEVDEVFGAVEQLA